MVFPFQEANNFYVTFRDHRTENLILKRKITELNLKVIQYEEARLENLRLRKLLDFQQRSNYPLYLATVIGQSRGLSPGEIIISGGKDKGLIAGMPVVTERGIAGKTEVVYSHSTLVKLLNAPGFAISGRIKRSRVSGVLKFNNGRFLMDNIRSTDDVRLGDIVLSSGMGGVFPKGIPIGDVTSCIAAPGMMFREIVVQPYVNLNTLEEVFVMMVLGAIDTTENALMEEDSTESTSLVDTLRYR